MSDYTNQLQFQNDVSIGQCCQFARELYDLWRQLGELDVRGLGAAEEAYWEAVDSREED